MAEHSTTCPNCDEVALVPSESDPEVYLVAWCVHPCIACNTPHVHPKTFTRDEVQSILLRYSVWLTGQHSTNPSSDHNPHIDLIPDE